MNERVKKKANQIQYFNSLYSVKNNNSVHYFSFGKSISVDFVELLELKLSELLGESGMMLSCDASTSKFRANCPTISLDLLALECDTQLPLFSSLSWS